MGTLVPFTSTIQITSGQTWNADTLDQQFSHAISGVIVFSDFSLIGDVNGDWIIDLLDIAPFVDAITDGVYVAQADINGDGQVDLLDVQGFVELLLLP